MAQDLPEAVTDMRNDRRQHQHDSIQRFLHDRTVIVRFCVESGNLVHELHDCCDGGIECVSTPDIVADLGDGLMRGAPQVALAIVQLAGMNLNRA